MSTEIVIHGAYTYGYGKEYYTLVFLQDRLVLCREFTELTMRRHKYSHIIDNYIRRLRIERKDLGECQEIHYRDIKDITTRTFKDKRDDKEEIILYIRTSDREYIIHVNRRKEKKLKQGLKLYKKYVGLI